MAQPDPFREGMARGWKTHDASRLPHDLQLETDVVVVGSGAGGGVTAEILAQAGFAVLLVEEGPLRTSSDFKLREPQAYAELYQEGIGRMSEDGAITILQGRAVGGTTLINWTSSFRTPPATLAHWAEHWDVRDHSEAAMEPWFARMEQRLGVAPWALPPNSNNEVIRRGCEALGYHWSVIPRNVRGCWNLGYCGLGCPVNAKQSMLVTTIPAMLEAGGELLYLARAERLLVEHDRVVGVDCLAMDERAVAPSGRRIRVHARHVVLAGGGINTPAILLRSQAPDPHGVVGQRTFLHLVNFSAAQFDEVVNPFYGAPQSIYSDHFQWQDGVSGRMSYKLEAPPLQPALASSLLGRAGSDNAQRMAQLPHTNMLLALLRDGFHPDSAAGTVKLRDDGTPVLDYRMTDYTWDGVRRAYHSMAEIQFAAGARAVLPIHADADYVKTPQAARELIDGLDLALYRTRLGSAHVMGGCAMGEDPRRAVVDSFGRHHQLENLSIHDGSIFPTSIGANPQLSVYAFAARLSSALVERLQSGGSSSVAGAQA